MIKMSKLFGMLITASALVFAGCSEDSPFQGSGNQGKVNLLLDVNTSAVTSRSASRASESTGAINVKAEDLSIRMTSSDGKWSQEWNSVKAFNNSSVPTGTHTLEAFYNTDESEGFDQPFIYGSKEITVVRDETTQVGLVAELANAMFSFNFDEALASYLSEYSIEILSSKGKTLAYEKDETKPLFVQPGEVSIFINLTKKDTGASARLSLANITAVKKTHYIVNVKFTEGAEPGTESITVKFDDTLVEESEIIVDISEEVLNTPEPTIETEGFTSGETMKLVLDGSLTDLNINIIAPAGITGATLTTTSPTSVNVNWAASIDLFNLSASDQEMYKEMGLQTFGIWKNPDKMAIVKLADVVNKATLNGEDTGEFTFTFTVESKSKTASASITIKATKEKVELAANGVDYRQGATSYSLLLTHNGSTTDELTLKYYDDNGILQAVNDVTRTTNADGTYSLTFPVIITRTTEFVITDKNGYVKSNEFEAAMLPSKTFQVNPVDVADSYAYFTITETVEGYDNLDYTSGFKDGSNTISPELYISTDGSTYTKITSSLEDGKLKVSGLKAYTGYWIKGSLTGKQEDATNATQFTTELTLTSVDAYATYAYFSLVDGNGNNYNSQATNFSVSSNGGNSYTAVTSSSSDGYVKVSGLNAYDSETTYLAKANLTLNGKAVSARGKFTTEAATQLPNAGMEDWYEKDPGGSLNYYTIWWAGESANSASWGTNNVMTTSQGAGYEYVRCSGTLADSGRGTAKSALLRTIGWGSGNTATSSNGGNGTMKYADPGLLHLGSTRSSRPADYSDHNGPITTDDLDCGIAFESRPSALTFYYKYTPKNSSDLGYAEYWVKDSSNNILTSGNIKLSATSDWTQASLPISYNIGGNKAAKIYIKFLSTYDRSFLTQSDENFSGPGFANLSHGKFLGSQLWIDDIELIY